jgi:hypothetical protein
MTITIWQNRFLPFIAWALIADASSHEILAHRLLIGYGRAAQWASDEVDRLTAA